MRANGFPGYHLGLKAYPDWHVVDISEAFGSAADRQSEGTEGRGKSKFWQKNVNFDPKFKESGQIVVTSFSGAKSYAFWDGQTLISTNFDLFCEKTCCRHIDVCWGNIDVCWGNTEMCWANTEMCFGGT